MYTYMICAKPWRVWQQKEKENSYNFHTSNFSNKFRTADIYSCFYRIIDTKTNKVKFTNN